jgi:hypothetical protein
VPGQQPDAVHQHGDGGALGCVDLVRGQVNELDAAPRPRRGQRGRLRSMAPEAIPAAAAGTWRLGDLTVHRLGFGAMRLTGRTPFGTGHRATGGQAVTVLRRAVELGVNHIDTAAFYFSPLRSANELINTALATDELLRTCGEQGIAFVPFFAIAGAGREAGAAAGAGSDAVLAAARAHGATPRERGRRGAAAVGGRNDPLSNRAAPVVRDQG